MKEFPLTFTSAWGRKEIIHIAWASFLGLAIIGLIVGWVIYFFNLPQYTGDEVGDLLVRSARSSAITGSLIALSSSLLMLIRIANALDYLSNWRRRQAEALATQVSHCSFLLDEPDNWPIVTAAIQGGADDITVKSGSGASTVQFHAPAVEPAEAPVEQLSRTSSQHWRILPGKKLTIIGSDVGAWLLAANPTGTTSVREHPVS